MNEEQIKNIVQEILDTREATNQFGYPQTPFHVHNGVDSPRVPANYLDFSNFAIWGSVGTNVGGSATIANQNILTSSVIVITPLTEAGGVGSFAASVSNGKASIASTGAAYQNSPFFYLIIF